MWNEICDLVLDNLSDDLLSSRWVRFKKFHPSLHKTFGHCYVASEVLYHMLGGKEEGWTPQYVEVKGVPHWFLKHNSGARLDVTAAQFESRIPYENARGKGFLTKQPSKRAKKLIARMVATPAWDRFIKNSCSVDE